MPDHSSRKQNSEKFNIRPAAFQRRFIASETDDANTLVALASDDSYFVRRQAVNNPHTPRWILELLVRAGASPDLRGRGDIDPGLDVSDLRRLVETGPWAQQLVAEHPNTSADVLAALKGQSSLSLRLAVATHGNANQETLAALCCAIEGSVRAAALANAHCPPELIALMAAAGATSDLQGVTRQWEALDEVRLNYLAALGPWGRFLVARHPGSPEDILVAVSRDADWRVRSGLLDNLHTSDSLIVTMLAPHTSFELDTIKSLNLPRIDDRRSWQIVTSRHPEVRFAMSRHPGATAVMLGQLATDGEREIRRTAAAHPHANTADLQRLIRAGSTPDLMGLSEPDNSMSANELRPLLDGGIWARQLAVRHPNADAQMVASLLCDREPKIREWAAVHPNLPPETKRDLIRAGSGTDFQGIMPPDPDLPVEALWEICELGSWGAWVVANNPHTPVTLLDKLATSDDWQVRLFVAKNEATPTGILSRLAHDPMDEVRLAAVVRLDAGSQ